MPTTLEERERLAYIGGHVEKAALLAQAADAEFIPNDDRVAELETELEEAQDEVAALQLKNADLQRELNEIRSLA